jgi:hypothetical protein
MGSRGCAKENYELCCANEILESASVSSSALMLWPGTCAKRRPPRREGSQGARASGGWRSASAAG